MGSKVFLGHRYTREQMIAIGGVSVFVDDGTPERIYLNNWPDIIGLTCVRTAKGRLTSAVLNGNEIRARDAEEILSGEIYWSSWDGRLRVEDGDGIAKYIGYEAIHAAIGMELSKV